jgi:hypothetical protein
MSDIENQPTTTVDDEQPPVVTSSASSASPLTPRKRRSGSLSTSAPSGQPLQTGERPARTSRRERLSGRGFLPPSSGGSFEDEALDEEADALATTDILLDLGRRISWFFGANLAINLPLRLVFVRQAARPLGFPQHSLLAEVKNLLPSTPSVSVAGGLPSSTSWKYILGTSALIGMSEVAAGLFAGVTSSTSPSLFNHLPGSNAPSSVL